MAARVDFAIGDNADEVFTFTFQNAAGQGIDYTGSSWRLDVKASPADASPALSLSSSGGEIDTAEAAEGTIAITFPEGGLAPGSYVHDLIRSEGGRNERVFAGAVSVVQGVTVIA